MNDTYYTDHCCFCCSDCYTQIFPVRNLRRGPPSPRIYSVSGQSTALCHNGDAGGVLSENITFISAPFGIPEIISCSLVAALHIWKRNTLLSIIGGTVCYMLLIQSDILT